MANIREIKRRIKSANNISQITRAMQMVAASKMKKAQDQALKGKPYAQKIHQAMAWFSGALDEQTHPLFVQSVDSPKELVILVSSNKGLCGSLNSNLLRSILNWYAKDANLIFVTLGKKGRNFAKGSRLLADFSKGSFLEAVPAVVQLIVDEFKKKDYRQVVIIYNTFVSSFEYQPTKVVILPLSWSTLGVQMKPPASIVVEPSLKMVVNSLIPHYLETQLRSAIYEAEACEHSARMIAMKNATDNAQALKEDLTLEYNKVRQQKITYEIADMVVARMAVE